MNRVIILEGPDGGGKTTLVEELCKSHGFCSMHCGVPPKGITSDALFNHYIGLLNTALQLRQPVVFDRHYLGETIYGPLMRGSSLLTQDQVKTIENDIHCQDVKTVVVLPPWEICRRNWLHKVGDYLPSEGKLLHIYEIYDQEAERLGAYKYDYTTTSAYHLIKELYAIPIKR